MRTVPEEPEAGRRARETRALRAVGLARRAGHAVVGTEAVLKAARADRLRVLVVAGDATENARGRVRKALRGPAAVVDLADRERLGRAVGRGPVAVVGITDRGLARNVAALARAPEARPRDEHRAAES